MIVDANQRYPARNGTIREKRRSFNSSVWLALWMPYSYYLSRTSRYVYIGFPEPIIFEMSSKSIQLLFLKQKEQQETSKNCMALSVCRRQYVQNETFVRFLKQPESCSKNDSRAILRLPIQI